MEHGSDATGGRPPEDKDSFICHPLERERERGSGRSLHSLLVLSLKYKVRYCLHIQASAVLASSSSKPKSSGLDPRSPHALTVGARCVPYGAIT